MNQLEVLSAESLRFRVRLPSAFDLQPGARERSHDTLTQMHLTGLVGRAIRGSFVWTEEPRAPK